MNKVSGVLLFLQKNKMKTLKELYQKAFKGHDITSKEFQEAFEEEHPEYKKRRLSYEQEKMTQCLDTMLRNFNPKWNPDDRTHSNDYWLYFVVDGEHITPQQVHDYFDGVMEENMKLKEKYEF